MQDETYFYADAILDINPKAAFWLIENDLNQLTWFDETTPIPDEQIKEVAKKLRIAYYEGQDKNLSDLDSIKTKLKGLGFTDNEISLFNLKNIILILLIYYENCDCRWWNCRVVNCFVCEKII